MPDPNGQDAGAFRVDDLGQEPVPAKPHELDTIDGEINRLPKMSPRAIGRLVYFVLSGLSALFVVVAVAFWNVPELVAVLTLLILFAGVVHVAGRHTISNLTKVIKSLPRSEKDDEEKDDE